MISLVLDGYEFTCIISVISTLPRFASDQLNM